jgi:hypothetical protein
MFSFMFNVLFSVIFWAIYLPASFVITIIIFKAFVPHWLNPVTKGKDLDGFELDNTDWVGFTAQFAGCIIFWPIIIIAIAAWSLVKFIGSKCILKLIRKTIDSVPTINITFRNNEKGDKASDK